MQFNGQTLLTANAPQPKQLLDWLYCPTSLTEKLQRLTGHAEPELVHQQWVNRTWWDAFLLGCVCKKVFQREILMQSNQHYFWYARTIISEYCYQQHPHFFDRLKKESVKHLIFHNPDIQVNNRVIYSINPQCLEYFWVKRYVPVLANVLWVRLTTFSYRQKGQFFLCEIFLPELERISE